jgi:uncharacterized protein YbaR (Trm112 family)
MGISRNFLQILACPRCKRKLQPKKMFLICKKCKLAYSILEKAIPDLLVEDAWNLSKAKKSNFTHKIIS